MVAIAARGNAVYSADSQGGIYAISNGVVRVLAELPLRPNITLCGLTSMAVTPGGILAIDCSGDVWDADWDGGLQLLTTVVAVAQGGKKPFITANDDSVYVGTNQLPMILRLGPDGGVTPLSTGLGLAASAAVDSDGGIWVDGDCVLERLDPGSGAVTFLAGNEDECEIVDGPAGQARFGLSGPIASSPDGAIYLFDGIRGTGTTLLRRVSPDSATVETLGSYPNCAAPGSGVGVGGDQMAVTLQGVFFPAGDWIGELPF